MSQGRRAPDDEAGAGGAARGGRWRASTAGIVAVVAGAGVGELVAALVADEASPFGAIGAVAIDLAPAWAKDLAIALFATNDKNALLTGIAVVLLAIGAAAGLVERRVPLLGRALVPLKESAVTLSCVSNTVGGGLVGNAVWLGHPVRDLLKRAAPLPGADMVLSRSHDGFTAGTPLEALTDDRDALLAVGMNGEPLPLAHGFPVRMVVPGLYGYVSATKWVVELEVTRFDEARAYWTDRGWSERGPIKLQSRIDVPRSRAVDAGEQVIAGVAWRPHTGVRGVEVQVDDGPWRAAALAAAISDDTWVQWSLPWTAEPGVHTIRCRATGADGERQTKVTAPTVPDGATGWHTIEVSVGS